MFADGHAAWRRLEQTLDPNRYQWGELAYSVPGSPPVWRADSNVPVN